MAKRKRKRKVGSSYITYRKIDGKRRKVKVIKVGKNREKVRIVGAKRRRKKRR